MGYDVHTQLNDLEMKDGRHLKINVSVPNLRLFVGNIPKSKGKAEIMEEFSKVTGKFHKIPLFTTHLIFSFFLNPLHSLSLDALGNFIFKLIFAPKA